MCNSSHAQRREDNRTFRFGRDRMSPSARSTATGHPLYQRQQLDKQLLQQSSCVCSRGCAEFVTEDDTRLATIEAGTVPTVMQAFSSTLDAAAHISRLAQA